MELRQYLYCNGDECEWNTGGWMRCKEEKTPYQGNPNYSSTRGTVNQKLEFTSDRIIISGSVSGSNVVIGGSVNFRGGGTVSAYIGTSNPLPISIQNYKSLQITGSNAGINYNIRTGAANDTNTTTSTATILQSGSGDNAALLLADSKPYFVVGKTLNYPAVGPSQWAYSSVYDSFAADITEIYLV